MARGRMFMRANIVCPPFGPNRLFQSHAGRRRLSVTFHGMRVSVGMAFQASSPRLRNAAAFGLAALRVSGRTRWTAKCDRCEPVALDMRCDARCGSPFRMGGSILNIQGQAIEAERRAPFWVLPGASPYTGAEGAACVKVPVFSGSFCFSLGFDHV